MGFLDRFRRQDDSDAFQDPSRMDPEEALRRAREGLAETGTHIDTNGNRRKLPKGAKDPINGTLDKLEQGMRRSDGRGDAG